MNHTGQRVSIQTQNRMREVRKRFMSFREAHRLLRTETAGTS